MTVLNNARNLQFTLSSGSGDADIYVRRVVSPTESSYDCRPWANGSQENCSFSEPTSGTYHVGVCAYAAFSHVTLMASYETGEAINETVDKMQENVTGAQGQWRN